jgi:thioredoxin reductase
VVVAVGRRGSPRGLDVPIDASMAGRIAYHLADAAALAGLSVLVSGLGDAAMEAAAGVAEQPAARVHVAYRGAELRTAGRDQRNVRRFRDLVDRGRIAVHWEHVVERVDAGAAVLRHVATGAEKSVPVDQVLVFHGGTSPKALLHSFGVTVG